MFIKQKKKENNKKNYQKTQSFLRKSQEPEVLGRCASAQLLKNVIIIICCCCCYMPAGVRMSRKKPSKQTAD